MIERAEDDELPSRGDDWRFVLLCGLIAFVSWFGAGLAFVGWLLAVQYLYAR